MLEQKRRAEIERLLTLRGRLLAPRLETVSRALRRCVKHAAQNDNSSSTDEVVSSGAVTDQLSPSATAALPTDALLSELAPSPTEEMRIATGIAQAVTEAESHTDDDNLDVGSLGGDTSGLIPTTIKQGERSVRGLAPGSVVKGYRIERLLGIGGMGQVYAALQLSMHRKVALKILSPRLARKPGFRDRFLREARNAGRLQHPNLIAVHDVDEWSGLTFFSMELIEGRTVREMIREEGALGEEQAVAIIRSCCEGLRYAHAQGLVHRDIKPDNIMVSFGGQVKIADLGLSRLEEAEDSADDAAVTSIGALMGTPYYMAPEQSRDAHTVDQRADIYSLGATLYHMIYGSVPFPGSNSMDVLLRSATQPLSFPARGGSKTVRTFIASCMEKDPADRLPSAATALDFLDGHFQIRPTTHGEALPAAYSRPQRGNPLRAWLFAVAIMVIVGVVIAVLVVGSDRLRVWNSQLHHIEQLTNQQRYYQAIQDLDTYRSSAPKRYRDPALVIRADLVSRWDAHVQEQYQGFLRRLDELAFQGRYAEAVEELARFRGDPSKMSPWMEQHLESFDHVLRSVPHEEK